MSSNLELFYTEDKGQVRWFRLRRDEEGNITAAQHAETLSERPMIVGKWCDLEALMNLESLTFYHVATGQAYSVAQDVTTHAHSMELDKDAPKKDPKALQAMLPVSIGNQLLALSNFYFDCVSGSLEPTPADFNRIEGIYYVLKADDDFARVMKAKMNSIAAFKGVDWLSAFNAKVESILNRARHIEDEKAAALLPADVDDITGENYWYTTQVNNLLMADLVRASFVEGSDWASQFTDPNRHAYFIPALRQQDVTAEFLRKEQANYFAAVKGQPAQDRAFTFTLNFGNSHWTTMTFDCKGYNPATKKYAEANVEFFDSAGSHITPEILAAVEAVYGVKVKIVNDRKQPTGSDCGPLSVEFARRFLQQQQDNDTAFTIAVVSELRRRHQALLSEVSDEIDTHKFGTKSEPGVAPKMVSSEWLPCFLKVHSGFKIEGNKAIYKTELPFGAEKKNAPVSVSVDAGGSVQIALPQGQPIPKEMLDLALKAFIMAQLKKKFPAKSADELDVILKDKAQYSKYVKHVKIDATDPMVHEQMTAHAKANGLAVDEPAPAQAAKTDKPARMEEEVPPLVRGLAA